MDLELERKLSHLEKDIAHIQYRNRAVELNKSWELSTTRRLSISIITYVVAMAWLIIIKEKDYALKAFVPVFGYILSTFTLPFIKSIWAKKQNKL